MPSTAERSRSRYRSKPAGLWPTLGGEVCDWIETYCVHGPGDVRGQSVTLTDEERRFIWHCYEIVPHGQARSGRRRWKRAAYVRRKGVRKTELAAWLTCAELLAPVRFDGWRSEGSNRVPVARTVRSPFIPVAVTSLEQSEDTLWGAVYAIASESTLVDDYGLDIGLDRIIELATGGEMKPVTSSSVSRDGGKPTFSPRDETHLWYSAELRKLDDTLLRNLRKRPIADPWALSTTTAWAPGQGSVAEREYEEYLLRPESVLWDFRGASEHVRGDDDAELREALRFASGDAAAWTDFDELVEEFYRGLRAESRRYWLNIPDSTETENSWLKDHPGVLEQCRSSGVELDPDGAPVAVGVDSALRSDSVAVWALQEQADGTVIGEARTWITDNGRIYDRAALRNYLRDLASRVSLKGIGYDPRYLESDAQDLADEGLPMIEVPQSAERMVPACRAGYELIVDRTLRHDVDAIATDQLNAAVPREADGGWRLSKGKSKRKIDSAVAFCIAEYVRTHVADVTPPREWFGAWA